jgi:hypothetical protein
LLKIAAAPRAMKVGHPRHGQQRRHYAQQQKGRAAEALARGFVEREHPCFLWGIVLGKPGSGRPGSLLLVYCCLAISLKSL